MLTVHELLHLVGEPEFRVLFKAATNFVGGMNRMDQACGCLTGGVLALGMKWGRSLDQLDLFAVYPNPKVQELVRWFLEQTNGKAGCTDIRGGVKLGDQEAIEKAREAGTLFDCVSLVGKTTRRVTELLMEEWKK